MKTRVIVTKESSTGRNLAFLDTKTNQPLTRAAFVKGINDGAYPDYHTRLIHGVITPVSNPNSSSGDNLG